MMAMVRMGAVRGWWLEAGVSRRAERRVAAPIRAADYRRRGRLRLGDCVLAMLSRIGSAASVSAGLDENSSNISRRPAAIGSEEIGAIRKCRPDVESRIPGGSPVRNK